MERQALARLNHPAVAQIFDAGQTSDGVPFFVMEHVEGEAINTFVARRRPTAEQCIELLRQIAEGLDHAHRRGLVHCDIKPSNLLVAELDGRPRAKLIDFGIAQGHGGEASGGSAGTPGYMSPEQATPGATVDARSDIYALGVVLFELISGERHRPADEPRARAPEAGFAQAARPMRRSLLETSCALPLSRARLAELDALLQRATAGDPNQRYQSAAQLAEDFAAWLARRPVSPLASSRRYRMACLWRRNPAAVSASTLGLLAVVAGLVGTGIGLIEARSQQIVAETRQAELEKVVAFQQQLLSRVDLPSLSERMVARLADNAARLAERDGGDIDAVRDSTRAQIEALAPVDATRAVIVEGLLHQAADLVDQQYSGGDGIEAALRLSLAQIFVPWQDFDRAGRELERSIGLYRELRGRDALETLTAETEALKLLWWRQSFGEAHERASELAPRAVAALGQMHPLSLYLMRAEAATRTLSGDSAGGLALAERLLPLMREAQGADHPDTLQLEGDILNTRTVLSPQRCSDALVGQFHAHLDRLRSRGAGVERTLSISTGNLATCLAINGDMVGAARVWGEAAEIRRRLFGEHHMITLLALADHGYYLLESGQIDASERSARAMLEQQSALMGGLSHPLLLNPRSHLLTIKSLRGEHEAAVDGFRALREEVDARDDLSHINRRWVLLSAGYAAQRARDWPLALQWLRDAIALCDSQQDLSPACHVAQVQLLVTREQSGETLDLDEVADVYERVSQVLHPHQSPVLHTAAVLYRESPDETLRQRLNRNHLDWLRAAPDESLGSDWIWIKRQLAEWDAQRP
ncbi:MAG: serine/threonine-protein kinase [Lysobacteraceae bacterium]